MKKLLLLLLLCLLAPAVVAAAKDAKGTATTVNGWVSDMKCGAKGANAAHADCLKKCLASGGKLALVTDSDQKVLGVDNPDALKEYGAQHVAVTGEISNGSIHVDGVKPLK